MANVEITNVEMANVENAFVEIANGDAASVVGSSRLDESDWPVTDDLVPVGDQPIGVAEDSSGIEFAAEETKPLVGISPSVSACQDLGLMSGLEQLPAEVLETTTTTINDDQSSPQQFLDKFIFELQHQQQQQSHFSLDDQWDESFEDLFPDLI
jgi:hypothetical protein